VSRLKSSTDGLNDATSTAADDPTFSLILITDGIDIC
jgi:hypothetical protein